MVSRNVGGIDRAVRIVVGAILLAAGLYLASTGGRYAVPAAAIGAIVLITGLVGFCPPYVWLGISTARRRARE